MQGMHGQGQMPGLQQQPMQGQGAMQGQAPGAMQGMHGQGQMPGMQPKPMQGQGPMQGQAPGAMQGGPPRNPVADDFFPPELVMQNQAVLGLKEEQASAIKTEMQKVMAHFTDLQWQQSAEEEKMATLTKQERIDEKQAVAQLDKLMGIENEIKRARIALLVRIKNTLTTDQQTKLRELGKQPGPRGPMPGGHGGANAPQPPPEGAPQPNL
jgi:Spy/CpxP family protein refolding chaperone